MVAEKPYIVLGDDGKYILMRPKVEFNKVGITKNWENSDEIDFSNVYVASDKDTSAIINAKLAEGLHILFQPGNYKLEDSIKVNNANTVLMGIGLATLISESGKPCIEVASVEGVRIAHFLLQAGTTNSPTLLDVGTQGHAGSSTNPVVLSDIYARVGGTNKTGNMMTDSMVNIDSGNVVLDNAWLWRADHQVGGGLVKYSRNPVKNGLVVNGDNVTTYGLAAEHTLEDLTLWNGNYGKSYFYQSEFPYDVTQANYGDKGYAGYKVASNVTHHTAWGTGVYSFFRDNDVTVASAIVAPKATNVVFNHALAVFLNGKGSITHIVNDQGVSVNKNGEVKYQCLYNESNPFVLLQ